MRMDSLVLPLLLLRPRPSLPRRLPQHSQRQRNATFNCCWGVNAAKLQLSKLLLLSLFVLLHLLLDLLLLLLPSSESPVSARLEFAPRVVRLLLKLGAEAAEDAS